MKSFFRIKQVVNLFICLIIVSSLAITKHDTLSNLNRRQKLQATTRYACLETEEQRLILLF